MGKYRLPIRLLVAGALCIGLSVWFFLTITSEEMEELRNVGFALLLAGLVAFVTGIVLWPRSKQKTEPPSSDEPTTRDSGAIEE
jgi:hypothetical protein